MIRDPNARSCQVALASGRRPRRSARAGVAGLEFALVSPILVVLFLGTIDISNALLTARRMSTAAGSVAQIASTSAVQTRTLNVLTDLQAWQATTAPFATFPGWTATIARQTFAITISAVNFTRTPSGYAADIVWSLANELGVARLRACGKLQPVPDNNPTSYTTLPQGNFGPTSLLVADVSYTFHPLFFGFLIGDINMMHSAYISPRINNETRLVVTGLAGVSVTCGHAG